MKMMKGYVEFAIFYVILKHWTMFMGIMLSWILVNTMALGICLTHCQLLDLLIVVKLM